MRRASMAGGGECCLLSVQVAFLCAARARRKNSRERSCKAVGVILSYAPVENLRVRRTVTRLKPSNFVPFTLKLHSALSRASYYKAHRKTARKRIPRRVL